MRENNQVHDTAVLVAAGISPDGERQVLGVSASLGEHETHWKAFLKGLKDRGLQGVEFVISDDYEGQGAVRRAVMARYPDSATSFACSKMLGRMSSSNYAG